MATVAMTTVVAKPSPCNGTHAFSSTVSKPSLTPFGPYFHPLRISVDHEHGSIHYNLIFMKPEQREKRLNMVVQCTGLPTPPPSAPSNPFSGLPGKGWIIGIALSFFLPFMKNKWAPLMYLKKQMDTTLERVEETVEVVEKVAEGVEKMAENIEDQLPDGHLKNIVSMVEHAAEQLDETAHAVDNTLERVEKLEEKFDERVESEIAKRQANAEAEKEANTTANKVDKNNTEEGGKIEKAI